MFTYEICCVSANGDDIQEMVDRAREITWHTFTRYVPASTIVEMFGNCPHPKDDWSVSFYRSKYQGRKCYFIDHSCIEYVFTDQRATLGA